MNPQDLKENFSSQLVKLEAEISKLKSALASRQELAIKLQGAIEAMQLQLGENPGETDVEEEVTSEQSEEVAAE